MVNLYGLHLIEFKETEATKIEETKEKEALSGSLTF